MVQVKFPALAIPAFKLTRGQLLNVSVIGVGLVIPPWDITFWEATKLTDEFVLFDTDAIVLETAKTIATIPVAVINAFSGELEKQIKEFKEKHPEVE